MLRMLPVVRGFLWLALVVVAAVAAVYALT
jgi:hypothetical protein